MEIVVQYGFTAVSIDRATPPWFRGIRIPELAPLPHIEKGFRDGTISPELFRLLYVKQLESINRSSGVMACIVGGARGIKNICLMSAEPAGTGHRSILREWLRQKGFVCKEISDRGPRTKKDVSK